MRLLKAILALTFLLFYSGQALSLECFSSCLSNYQQTSKTDCHSDTSSKKERTSCKTMQSLDYLSVNALQIEGSFEVSKIFTVDTKKLLKPAVTIQSIFQHSMWTAYHRPPLYILKQEFII